LIGALHAERIAAKRDRAFSAFKRLSNRTAM